MDSLFHSRHAVWNAYDRAERVNLSHRSRGLTADTRATVDGVLDPRTMLILRKFRSAGHFDEMGGAISTGKEANVYSAVARVHISKQNQATQVQAVPRAIKIFKTSILVFKNRRQYVEGEHRFRHGYMSSSNPRKMVRQWAEKEFRNLKRIYQMGLRGPVPICLRGHAFIMSMIGADDTTPAPRLRDYPARDIQEWKRVYIEVLALMRCLYQRCELVHGDFSEYNILFHSGHPYIIDVSQATDDSHVHAEGFLKRDCHNIACFFKRKCGGIFDYEAAEEQPADDLYSSDKSDGESDSAAHDVAPDEDSNEFSVSASDTDSETSMPDIARNPRQIHFEKEDKFHTGASALNKWKWDAALAEENEWNRLQNYMSEGMLSELDGIEVMNTENTYNYVTKKVLNISEELPRWPSFDKDYRKEAWEIMTYGQRILNNKEATNNEDREIAEEHKQLSIDYDTLLQQCNFFNQECSATLRFVTKMKGLNTEEDNSVFINTLAPQSLHELSTLDVEKELNKIERGEESKYAKYLDANVKDSDVESASALEDESDSDQESEMETDKKFDGNIPEGVDPKDWKKQVKAANRERRQHKMKKKDKKQKIKKSKKR